MNNLTPTNAANSIPEATPGNRIAHKIRHVAWLQIQRDRWGGPILLIIVLTAFPLLLIGIRDMVLIYNPFDLFPHALSDATTRNPLSEMKQFAVFFQSYFLFSFIVIALYSGAHLFKDEFSNRTMHLLLHCSVERQWILAGKLLAFLVISVPLCLLAVCGSYLLMLVPTGFPKISEFLVHQKGSLILLQFMMITVLAVFTYGALAIFFGLAFKNPNLPGIVLLLWELMIAYVPGILKPISIAYYLQSLLPVSIPRYKVFEILANPASPSVSILVPLLVSIFFLTGSHLVLKKKEILYT